MSVVVTRHAARFHENRSRSLLFDVITKLDTGASLNLVDILLNWMPNVVCLVKVISN